MGGLSLLQGIFTTQGSNQGLLHWGRILYHLSYQGSYIGRGALVTEGPPLGSLGRPSHCGLFCRVPLLGQLLLWSARARTASTRQEPLRLADLPQGACGRALFPPCHLPRSQAAGWRPAAADRQLWPGKETQQVTHGLQQPLPRRRSRDVQPPEFTLPPI